MALVRATLRRFGLEAVKAVASVSSLDLDKEPSPPSHSLRSCLWFYLVRAVIRSSLATPLVRATPSRPTSASVRAVASRLGAASVRAAVRRSGSAAVSAAARVSSRASVKAILSRSPFTPLVRAVASRLAFALVRATCDKLG